MCDKLMISASQTERRAGNSIVYTQIPPTLNSVQIKGKMKVILMPKDLLIFYG